MTGTKYKLSQSKVGAKPTGGHTGNDTQITHTQEKENGTYDHVIKSHSGKINSSVV